MRTEAEGNKILCVSFFFFFSSLVKWCGLILKRKTEFNILSFQELEKGKYANTDIYFYHMYINKDVVLLTDKRIAYVERSELFGGWKVGINGAQNFA